MSKHSKPFVFKQFAVRHSRSSIKVGVDAVLLGAWATPEHNKSRMLDVGCGCGVISLMMAQRFPESEVIAIDIDEGSVEECKENILNSNWADRVEAKLAGFDEYCNHCMQNGIKFDLIFSNPPFYDDGLMELDSPRLKARHQGDLNPFSFIKGCKEIVNEEGIIAMIFPWKDREKIIQSGLGLGLELKRMLYVSDSSAKQAKRCLVEFKNRENSQREMQENEHEDKTDYLVLKNCDGSFTPDYISLCKDFYLKF